MLLREAPYLKCVRRLSFLPVEPPMQWDTFFCLPPNNSRGPQCQGLYRAQTRSRQGFLSLQLREKEQPPRVTPPAPTVPVNSTSIVIICCCTCRGLYVSRDVEVRGLLRTCDFRLPGCGRVQLYGTGSEFLYLRTTICRPSLILGKESVQEGPYSI